MNHEILSTIAPKEYYKAFLSKNLRKDKRQFFEKRNFIYNDNVLNTEQYSCTNCLGDANKVLCVLKKDIEKSSLVNYNESMGHFNTIIDHCGNENSLYFDETDLVNYVKQLLK
jgi:hypothetical protein